MEHTLTHFGYTHTHTPIGQSQLMFLNLDKQRNMFKVLLEFSYSNNNNK